MLNNCIFCGRLVEDPKLFQGDPVRCCFTIAVDRDGSNKNGGNADYFDFVAWRDTADYVSRHFNKGDLIQVVSRAKVRSYEDSEGIKKRKTEFEVDKVYCILRNRNKEEDQAEI